MNLKTEGRGKEAKHNRIGLWGSLCIKFRNGQKESMVF